MTGGLHDTHATLVIYTEAPTVQPIVRNTAHSDQDSHQGTITK
jgi:hypothetical protein